MKNKKKEMSNSDYQLKLQLRKIKQNAFYLFDKGCIPSALMSIINALQYDESNIVEKVAIIKDISEPLIRIKGYWDRHKDEHIECNKHVRLLYQESVKRIKEVD